MEEVMKINVGGKIFTTTTTTLSEIPYFKKILDLLKAKEGEEILKITFDENKHVFVDRSPEFFEVILEYIRTDEFNPEEYTIVQLNKIKRECDFYVVDSLRDEIDEILKEPFLEVALQSNGFSEALQKGYLVHHYIPKKHCWRFCPHNHDASPITEIDTECTHSWVGTMAVMRVFAVMKRCKPIFQPQIPDVPPGEKEIHEGRK